VFDDLVLDVGADELVELLVTLADLEALTARRI